MGNKRSKIEIYCKVLEICDTDTIFSVIGRKAKLSYYATQEFVEYLLELGLLDKYRKQWHTSEHQEITQRPTKNPVYREYYRISPKGIEALPKIKEVLEMFA